MDSFKGEPCTALRTSRLQQQALCPPSRWPIAAEFDWKHQWVQYFCISIDTFYGQVARKRNTTSINSCCKWRHDRTRAAWILFWNVYWEKKIILETSLDKWVVSLCPRHSWDWSPPDLGTWVDARWRCCSTFWGESLEASAAALWLGCNVRNRVSMTKWQIWTATAFCSTGHRTDMWNVVGWLLCYTRGRFFSPSMSLQFLFPPTSWNIYTPGHHFVHTRTRAPAVIVKHLIVT